MAGEQQFWWRYIYMVILKTINISKSFGGLKAVNNVSLDIYSGKITAVIGPNGAGKTTLFNLLTGFLEADSGKIFFCEKDVTKTPAYRIARMGMTRTFQRVRILPKLTLLENIMIGYNDVEGNTLFSAVMGTKNMIKLYRQKKEEAKEILNYIGLEKYTNSLAKELSYGQQKLLEIGRVLASKPNVLLLDEPFSGLNVIMIEKMVDLIMDIKKQGKTILIIEHNIGVVTEISDWINVLNFGELIASDVPDNVIKNEAVIDSYLGI